jgi:senataxin
MFECAGGSFESVAEALQISLLNDAQIVFCTLSGSGAKVLTALDRGFDVCIVDEAGQCAELSILIPLRLRVKTCILVGDPR